MKEIIEKLAEDVDILDKVHAKPGEVFKMQIDYDADKDSDIASVKSAAKSDQSSKTSKSMNSSVDWGNRKSRKHL